MNKCRECAHLRQRLQEVDATCQELRQRYKSAQEHLANLHQGDIETLRKTNKRLNRRVQQAEAALLEFEKIQNKLPDEQGIRFIQGSLGRALLAWGWEKQRKELEELKRRKESDECSNHGRSRIRGC